MSSKQNTILYVFGTRPELIKMAPLIIDSKKNSSLNTIICSTGQHQELLEPLYSLFEFRPDFDFKLMKPNQTLTQLHADIMLRMNDLIDQTNPDWVVVQGDTTSAAAAALSAFYKKVKVAHVEAGLRTYDINSPFPEEMNRRAIGLVASAHFCPTEIAKENIESEKIGTADSLYITGNTGIDTLLYTSNKILTVDAIKSEYEKYFSFLNLTNFVLLTFHRRENFGVRQQNVLKSVLELAKNTKADFLFPVHPNPNVRASVEKIFGSEMSKSVFWQSDIETQRNTEVHADSGRIFLVDPLEYSKMVFCLMKCKFVMTDSGGLQEEAPTFGKKILVLRDSTERPEGLKFGFSELVGTDPQKILTLSASLLSHDQHWLNNEIPKNPYGDGQASKRILNILTK